MSVPRPTPRQKKDINLRCGAPAMRNHTGLPQAPQTNSPATSLPTTHGLPRKHHPAHSHAPARARRIRGIKAGSTGRTITAVAAG